MDFSTELENQTGLDSPVISRKKILPSRFLFFKDLTLKQKAELESLLSADRPLSVTPKQGGIQVEFQDSPSALDALAKLHQLQLSDGR